MRVLVTGGAGFIGSHLCESLLADGHRVICADNLSTGRMTNIAHLLRSNRFEFVRHDVTEPLTDDVDFICNLACPASPSAYQRDPIKTFETSVVGISNLLRLAERLHVPLLQASTSEIYGDPLISPQRESYWGHVNPIGVRSCYDEGKRAAETLCTDYCRLRRVDTKIVRIFNTYGPNMDPNDGRVASNFIVQALKGEDLTVYGKGTQTRTFCFVSDLISGIRAMMVANSAGPVNLGNPDEFSILQLAEHVLAITGSRAKIAFRELPADDPKQRRPDISLARERLGWEPKVALDDGLKTTVSYFRRSVLEGGALQEA